MRSETNLDYEVVVVGAGVAGIYQIKRLIDMGIKATVLEADADLGGTWYNNRYPGARFDSESYTYGYSFSKEILDEWHWKEMFSGQPENLKYLNFVADKFNLRQHMQFNCRVQSAIFNESEELWDIKVSDGRELRCRVLILALGLLSQPTMPRVEGVEDFQGRSWHTYNWPHEQVDLRDQRVGVVGTGATAIQVIGEIADKVGELTVFQRRPNWVAPLNNSEISPAQMDEIRARYDEIFETCARTPGGFEHEPDRRGFYEVSQEERYELWDQLYDEPGFAIWLRNFREIFTDEEANAEISAYIAERIRGRVEDPEVAEKLIPKDHGFGVQRVPMETGYLEAFNRENVQLVDISETPIERVTETGIRTSDGDYDFDIIVYATGFDAITGSFDHIDIRGRNGMTLKEKWFDSPTTFLGMMVSGFPNLLMPSGPQSGSASTNYPRGIENGVDWCTEMLEYLYDNELGYFEATEEAESRWTEHVVKMYSVMLMRKAQSWFTGYNSNVDGHEAGKVRYMVYNGGTPKYVATIADVADKDYEGIRFSNDAHMPVEVVTAD
ncbi:MAG: cyclohexanone monooxygenase [Acidimicrobiaceae bacterium]|jgi:cation diffusion facilitator CzcD-associated flavoprotein CzcO|nr:cyclohexanone monooxygenase [Acidimicrobiaceae bacterium]MCH2632933.1 NAD(P)/FAD-dependent oxidoreductase [Acidimicrobiales bacterium]HBV24295.1 cyclohexanone monooxygenase [Acidimicrobiaceae bacterium]HCK73340.1 cyclohexanone monooxygenase [Acidimicrobiaceae bacterium]